MNNENKPRENIQRPGLGPGPGPGPGRGPMGRAMAGEKAKDFKGTMKKLAAYLGKYKWPLLFVALLSAMSTVFSIIGPRIMGKATDVLYAGLMNRLAGSGSVDFDKIGKILISLAVLYGAGAALSYLQGFVISHVTAKVTQKLRSDIFNKMHRLPFRFYDKTTHGEVLSRITNDVDTISQTLTQSLPQIISALTTVTGVTVMMLGISFRLTLVAFCVVPVSMFFVVAIVKKSQKHFKNQQKHLGEVNSHVEEMFGSHAVIKAFSKEEESVETFSRYNDDLYTATQKAHFLSGLIMPVTSFVRNLGYVAVCIVGALFATKGTISVGDIQAFLQYVRSLHHPVSQISNISNVLQQTAAAAERVFELLLQEEEVADRPDAITINRDSSAADTALSKHIRGQVRFENVNFGYTAGKNVINNFSACINPGQKIAIVGPTGAGKTTIVKLLMRFYDVTQGSISVDGNDIRLFKRNELRSLFGMVLQETWLFSGTIADNIRYGKTDATDEEVQRAAEFARADHFIRTLPGGYNMVLNEEVSNISQGQKQLLTIARAFLADPQILILDEATSSVDTRTEQLIQKGMESLMKGRTAFIIAHRLSTIRNADLILVMNEGDIVEKGTHSELLAEKGFYANLYYSQFETAG